MACETFQALGPLLNMTHSVASLGCDVFGSASTVVHYESFLGTRCRFVSIIVQALNYFEFIDDAGNGRY